MSDRKTNVTAYAQLEAQFEELHQLGHAQAMLNWDEAVMMPRGGGPARGEALAALAALAHRALTARRSAICWTRPAPIVRR